jgi:glycosyltransferase involved in cell wall biosynthesis
MKPTILIFTEYYLPGSKGGGPIISIKNMVDALSDYYNFKIITLDRDLGDSKRYSNINQGWNKVGKAQVLYLSPEELKIITFTSLFQKEDFDILYFNSFFSPYFTFKPLWAYRCLKLRKPVVIAPRGEFSPGALKIKPLIKRFYLLLAKHIFPKNRIIFQASSEMEKREIRKVIKKQEIVIAPNLRTQPKEDIGSPDKSKGCLKAIFLSRISPKKNLDTALRILKNVKGKLTFDVYGPIEDKAYWHRCQSLMKLLPKNIKVVYKGQLSHKEVIPTMSNYHLFFFPTRGENYGHVIHEALLAGCPILISDQTPWQNPKEKGIGWNIPLNKEQEFIKALEYMISLSRNEFRKMSKSAREYGIRISKDKKVIQQNIELFNKSIKNLK